MFQRFCKPVILTLIGAAFLAALYLSGIYSELLFQNITGVLCVIIAAAISLIAWVCRNHTENNYFVLIGIAYLFVGILGFIDTLSISGMVIFTGNNSSCSQAWILMRYIESFTLLAALIALGKKVKTNYIAPVYSVILAAVIFSVFYFKIFSENIVTVNEYIITLILISGIILLITNRKELEGKLFKYLLPSYILNVLCELTLTPYINGYYASTLLGPCFRILSMYFMLKVIIQVYILTPHEYLLKQLKLKQNQLDTAAAVDSLTGIFNRSATYSTLEKLIKLSKRNEQDLSICYMGLDNLDEVVDLYGEGEGDALVNLFISALKESTRLSDYICRFDDDEFLLILPDCGSRKVYVILERIKENLSALNSGASKPYAIGFSYGIASYNYNNTFDVETFLKIADYDLYQNRAMKSAANNGAYEDSNIIIRGTLSDI